jgi:hypothetical protein
MAETYVEVSMKGGNGFPMKFALGKYTGIDDWGFQIQGRHGYVYVNLDSRVHSMTIDSPVFKGVITIEASPKYSIVISDFMRRVRDPSLQHEYGFENCRDTLELVLRIKDEFNKKPYYFPYETGELPSMREIVKMYRK